MKKVTYMIIGLSLLTYSCGSGYDKSPEDWSTEICKCASEKGHDAKECLDLLDELKGYYAEDDSKLHDEATTKIGENCAEFLINSGYQAN